MSVDYRAPLAGGRFQTTAYGFKYDLNRCSRTSRSSRDPVNGDQFEQADDRNVLGWTGDWARVDDWGGRRVRNSLGYELRQDRIDPVGLHATRARARLSTIARGPRDRRQRRHLRANEVQWPQWLRSVVGLRYDHYRFDVTSTTPGTPAPGRPGSRRRKLSLVFGPWQRTELFVNGGYGFHSNDARGVTITRRSVDAATPVDPATPLVRSRGAEIGARTEAIRDVQSSVALWYLKLDSELAFVGDAGTTEAGRPSRRYGVEWNTRWRPRPWMFVDLDCRVEPCALRGDAPEGNYIPGAPETVLSAGVAIQQFGPWSGALFLRYIGPYPLTRRQQRARQVLDGGRRADRLPAVTARCNYGSTASTSSTPRPMTLPTTTPRGCRASRREASTTCTFIRRNLAASGSR